MIFYHYPTKSFNRAFLKNVTDLSSHDVHSVFSSNCQEINETRKFYEFVKVRIGNGTKPS